MSMQKEMEEFTRSIPKYGHGAINFASYLTWRKGVITEHVFWIRNYAHDITCHEVIRRFSDGRPTLIRDLDYMYMAGYRLCTYAKGWVVYDWTGFGIVKRFFPVVNYDKFIEHFPQYKNSHADEQQDVGVLEYLKTWESHKAIEWLCHAHVTPSKDAIKLAEADKGFRKLLASRDDWHESGAMMVKHYKTGVPLSFLHKITGMKLYGWPIQKLYHYISSRDIDIQCYKDYMEAGKYLNYDFTDERFMFPHHFMQRHDETIENRRVAERLYWEEVNRRNAAERAVQAERYRLSMIENAMENPHIKSYFGEDGLCYLAEQYVPHIEDDTFDFVMPHTVAEFVEESRQMNNCVGKTNNYCGGMALQKFIILFVRKKDSMDQSYCTLQVDKDNVIMQCLCQHNSKADDECRAYCERLCESIDPKVFTIKKSA